MTKHYKYIKKGDKKKEILAIMKELPDNPIDKKDVEWRKEDKRVECIWVKDGCIGWTKGWVYKKIDNDKYDEEKDFICKDITEEEIVLHLL